MIRFDHFMAESLYGNNGYYTSPRPILGRRGDFTTAPKLTKSLAKAIAAWIKMEWKNHGQKLPVIELGPGDGTLAASLRQHFSVFTRRNLDYHFVEVSPHLRERQLEAVNAINGRATAHKTLTEACAAAGKEALILSNEFFDAFPVRIFKNEAEGFSELHLEGITEHWIPTATSDLPESTVFEQKWPLGQRLEVAESIHRWIKDELSLLKRGTILTIDYGETLEDLYQRRPMGSIRAYAHHQRLHPPEAYLNPGRQDLTFDVNFTDLAEWGRQIGITPMSLETQGSFTEGYGPSLNQEADRAFKVLIQKVCTLSSP
ncbi:MAG: SAM-dependent methyltransferase [Akkermansiaceae bacterium]